MFPRSPNDIDGKIWLPEHGCFVDVEIDAPCGEVAEFDYGAGYGYRCTSCNAVLGSIGMPKACAEIAEADKIVEILKGDKRGRGKLNQIYR